MQSSSPEKNQSASEDRARTVSSPLFDREMILQPFSAVGYDCSNFYPEQMSVLLSLSKNLHYYQIWEFIFGDFLDEKHPENIFDSYYAAALEHALNSKNPFIVAHVLDILLRVTPSPMRIFQSSFLRTRIVAQFADILERYPLFGHHLQLKYLELLAHYQPARKAKQEFIEQQRAEDAAIRQLSAATDAHPMDRVCLTQNALGQSLYQFTYHSERLMEEDLPSFGLY